MMQFEEIRAQFPQYNDLSDEQLAKALHGKYYSDLGYEEFTDRVGVSDAKPAKESVSRGRTLLDQGLQGVTFGLADEAVDRIGAGIASLATDESYSDLLEEARGNTKERFARQFEERPALSIAANLGGALLTGGAGATTKAGKSLATGLRSGNALARIAKGGVAGATSGAAYGAGTANDGGRIEGATDGAIIGGLIGGAFPAAGAAYSGVKNAIIPEVGDSAKDIAKLAQKHKIPLGLDQLTGDKSRQFLSKAANRLPLTNGGKLYEQQQEAFNIAVGKTIGVDNAKRLTNEVYDKALERIGKKFDSVTKGKTVNINDSFKLKLESLVLDAEDSLDDGLAKVVRKNVDKVLDSLGDSNTVSGEKLASLRTSIGNNQRRAQAGSKEFLGDLVDSIVDATVDGTPGARKTLNEARKQYKNALAIEPLVAKASDGNLSPALLKGGVTRVFKNRALAKGQAGELGELVKVADLIKNRVGDSGTAETMVAYGALGGTAPATFLEPTIGLGALGALGTARAYNAYNASQALVNKALQDSASKVTATGLMPSLLAGQQGGQGRVAASSTQNLTPELQKKLCENKGRF